MPAKKPADRAASLPPIPDKRYFTIGEVSELCAIKQHVLRYWEQEFPALKQVKRRGNRRYYQPHEVMLIRRIRGLLYDEGFTIHGARAALESGKGKSIGGESPSLSSSTVSPPTPVSVPSELRAEIQAIIDFLKH